MGVLRRAVHQRALELGASESECGRAALAATELGTNAIFHGGPSSYALVQPLPSSAGCGLEILAVDRGPGIRDIESVLRVRTPPEIEEALSSGRPRGLGCGLGAVRRVASEFDIHSAVGKGTVVLARFFFGPPAPAVPPSRAFQWAGVSIPMVKDDYNGDAWSFVQLGSQAALLVVDGLGHGPSAAEAAQTAVAEFHRRFDGDIPAYFERAHAAMRATRGAAVLLCCLDPGAGSVSCGGLGNVEGRIFSETRGAALTPQNGTLGMYLSAPKIAVRQAPWGRGDLLIVHSDGVRAPGDLVHHNMLSKRDPAVIAAVLHRDLARGKDDATVVVVRDTRGGDDDGSGGPG